MPAVLIASLVDDVCGDDDADPDDSICFVVQKSQNGMKTIDIAIAHRLVDMS